MMRIRLQHVVVVLESPSQSAGSQVRALVDADRPRRNKENFGYP
jgi:hypothetical protein